MRLGLWHLSELRRLRAVRHMSAVGVDGGRPRVRSLRRPIVVGVSDAVAQRMVIEWAAVRARSSDADLLVVHAYEWPLVVDPFGIISWLETAPVARATAVVEEAARYARDAAPGVRVQTRLRRSSPAAALLAEGRKAELIVVGRSTPSRFWPWIVTVNDELRWRAKGRTVIVDKDGETLV